MATTLAQAGKEVLAVDKDPELVQEIADLVTYAARADITDSRVFASLGISNMDVVIVGIAENMESSILATLQAKVRLIIRPHPALSRRSRTARCG